jgi:hypothetical protein
VKTRKFQYHDEPGTPHRNDKSTDSETKAIIGPCLFSNINIRQSFVNWPLSVLVWWKQQQEKVAGTQ